MSLEGVYTNTNLDVLRGKIKNITPNAIDKTLTVSGAGADAKVVGDALEQKVNYKDIVNDLKTDSARLPLSARQGYELSKRVGNVQIYVETSILYAKAALEASAKAKYDSESVMNLVDSANNNAEIANNHATEAKENAASAKNTADEFKTKLENLQAEVDEAKATTTAKLAKDGSEEMEGDLKMGNHKISGVTDPTDKNDVANKQYVDSKLPVKVWTNEDATTTFTGKKISLDTTGYGGVSFFFKNSVNGTTHRSSGVYEKGYQCALECLYTSGEACFRNFTVSDDGIEFQDAMYDGEVNNSYLIPVFIYGWKL